MKSIALALFIVGVATVNAGTTETSTSSAGALPAGQGAVFPLIPSGDARAIAASGGTTAGAGINVNANNGFKSDHTDSW
jgi:hypothetical protein